MFNKYSCGIEFYIIESNKHDMILGTNYFRAMNAGVIFENNEPIIIFGNKSYSIDQSFDEFNFIKYNDNNFNNEREIEITAVDDLDEDDLDVDFEPPILYKSIKIDPEIQTNQINLIK